MRLGDGNDSRKQQGDLMYALGAGLRLSLVVFGVIYVGELGCELRNWSLRGVYKVGMTIMIMTDIRLLSLRVCKRTKQENI